GRLTTKQNPAGGASRLRRSLFSCDFRKPFLQIVGIHDWHELGCCVQIEKERLNRLDDLRGLGHIKKYHAGTLAVLETLPSTPTARAMRGTPTPSGKCPPPSGGVAARQSTR